MSIAEFYSDMLGFLDDLRIRSMFGGYGVYGGAHMFGLIDDGDLYFKVDDASRSDFQALDSAPFSYVAKGKTMVMNGYWRVPDGVLEEPERLSAWAERALSVARKAKARVPAAKRAAPSPDFGGLGKVSRGWLAEIGINSLDDLKREGAIFSFKALKAKYPKRVSFNLLWGLYALVNDVALKAVDEETKSHLKSLLRDSGH